MCTMDLSVNQEVIRMHQRYETEYGSHVFKLQEAYKETDITGNNNFFNSLKTETRKDADDPTPIFQVNYSDDKDFKVDNSLFSYSSFKKAMDLRIHNRTIDGGKRTIFDDAEYFARNCCYKLLPITFEQVDETIIHTEHNYSLCSLDSESEPEEDCSRTMDYSQIREKNYKKRKTKCRESSDQEEAEAGNEEAVRPLLCSTLSPSRTNINRSLTAIYENYQDDSGPVVVQPDVSLRQQPQDENLSANSEQENQFAGQPLDLSASPVVQEEKTEALSCSPEETGQPDSDKENVSAALSGIRVTITRPDEKENYQPCDMFLNDIARLVPWLIDKDCFEVDILDRTCDCNDEIRKHRLYYVIAESTWRSFQSTNERVILTNDQSLGEPLRKMEKDERPSYLVFDQLSLAKCLAEYCQEIGGCFEYRCVEAELSGRCVEEKSGVMEEAKQEEVEKIKAVEPEEVQARAVEEEGGDLAEEEMRTNAKEKIEKEDSNEAEEEEEKMGKGEEGEMAEAEERTREVLSEGGEKLKKEDRFDVNGATQKSEFLDGPLKIAAEIKVDLSLAVSEAQRLSHVENAGECSVASTLKKMPEEKGERVRTRSSKSKGQPPIQVEPKNTRITTRSMSTSEFETSQKSDKRVNKKEGRKRRNPTPPRQEPPNKHRRVSKPEEVIRSRRTAMPTQRVEVKAERTHAKKGSVKKAESEKETTKRKENRKKVEERKNVQRTGRSLRSGAAAANEQKKPVCERRKSKRR